MVLETANVAGTESFPLADMRALLKAMRRIARANDLQSRALARRTGLTAPQMVILTGVMELGEVTTRALSDYADLSPATVVTVLDNLEERGIVERYRSKSDRRIVHTRLTPAGNHLVTATPGLFGTSFAARFAACSAQERRQLVASLVRLADMMGA